jgi:hypothetical protein
MPKTQYFDGTDWNDVSDIYMFVPDAFDPDLDDPTVWAAIEGKVTTQNSNPTAAVHPVQRQGEADLALPTALASVATWIFAGFGYNNAPGGTVAVVPEGLKVTFGTGEPKHSMFCRSDLLVGGIQTGQRYRLAVDITPSGGARVRAAQAFTASGQPSVGQDVRQTVTVEFGDGNAFLGLETVDNDPQGSVIIHGISIHKVTADAGDRPGTWVPVNPASFKGAPGAADPAAKFRKWLNPDPPVVVPPGAISVTIASLPASVYVGTKVTVVVRASNANTTRPMTVTITAPGATSISGAQTVPAKTTKDLTFTFIAPTSAVAALAVTAHGSSAAGAGTASNPVTNVKNTKVLAKPANITVGSALFDGARAEMYAKNSGTTFTKQVTNHEHDLNQGKFTGSGTATTGVRMSWIGIMTSKISIPALPPKSITVYITRATTGGVSGDVATWLRLTKLGPSVPASLGTGTASALQAVGAPIHHPVGRGEKVAFTFTDPVIMAAWAAKQIHGVIIGDPSLGTAEYANYEKNLTMTIAY